MKFILERKNYGELYHFSSLINIYGIIKTNMIEGGEGWFSNKNPKYKDHNVVSLTRTKSFGKLREEFSTAYVALNGEKLTDKYKVVPHDFFHFYHNPKKHNKGSKNFEFEETILLKNEQYLKPIDKYIEYIHIPEFKEFYNHYIEYVEQVDFKTQIGRVIEIARDLNIKDIPSVGQLDKDQDLHKTFLFNVYTEIKNYIKGKFDIK